MTVKGLLLMACSVNLGYFVPVLHPVSTTANTVRIIPPLLFPTSLRFSGDARQFLSSSTGTGPLTPLNWVPYPRSRDLCCPIRETSLHLWGIRCVHRRLWWELLWQSWLPKMKATVWTGLPQQSKKQISGDITRNLATGRFLRSAPRLPSSGSSIKPVCTQTWLS